VVWLWERCATFEMRAFFDDVEELIILNGEEPC
jgi:hypothetical protein